MGFEGLKIANQTKRGLIFTTRICYRSAYNHPFLLCFVFFLIFLYRSFPFVFSILVSSSPVLVCTIVLLGTLLSFGQPHIPEIEKDIEKEIEKEVENDEEIRHEIAALKSPCGVLEDTVVVERGDCIGVAEKVIEDRGLKEIDVDKVEKSYGLIECAEENSRKIHSGKTVIEEEEEEEFNDFQCGLMENIHEEKVRDEGEGVMNKYTLIRSLEDEDHELEEDDKEKMGDGLGFSPDSSSWKHEEDEDEPSDSGSDGGESSSSDASMTDIIPLLDELHPLLDSEPPQPVLVSHGDSDANSEHSLKSNDGSAESSQDSEIRQRGDEEDDDEEGDDDDDDDDEEEEEEEEDIPGIKEDESRSGITWTEDDQKNLLDLGTSELERNQRLENLIMRRKARKNMKTVVAEKNLIDLESADPPFHVPPISTRRRNPFDSPFDDSYDNMGLPPIPGSAPSIMAPRRNPFDLPYDSSEEKPDLKGDSFEQEFMALHQKDMLFRRHESFSLGASSLGGPRQERQQHIKWRPYFVPERMAGEGTSYPVVFERQSSGFSDSKASSVPETESVSSAVEEEEEEEEDTKVNDLDVPRETDVMFNIDHISSEVSDSEESEQVEKTEIDLNVAAQPTDEVNHHEIDMSEVHPEEEAGEEKYSSSSSRSSSSRSSEASEHSFEMKPDEESSILESRKVEVIEEESDFSSITRIVEEPVYDLSPRAVKKNLSSSSTSSDLPVEMPEIGVPATVSSEVGKEIIEGAYSNEETSETPSQLHVVGENESRSEEVKEMSEHDDDTEFRFSTVDQNSNIPRSEALKSVSEHISTDSGSSASDTESVENVMMHKDESFQHEQDQVDQETSENRNLMTSQDRDIPSESTALSAMGEQIPFVVEQVSEVHHNLTNSEEEDSAEKEENPLFEHHQVHQDVDEKPVSVDVSNLSSSETKSAEENSTTMEETLHLEPHLVTSSSSDAEISDQQDVDEKRVSSSETNSAGEDSTTMEETVRFEHNQTPSSRSDAKIDGSNLSSPTGNEETLEFEHDGSQNVTSREMPLSELEKSLPSTLSDKSTVEPSVDDHDEVTAHEEPHEPYELRSHEREVSENSSPSSSLDPKYRTVDGVENDNQELSGLVLLGFPVAVSPAVLEENVDDEEDNEIEEFDEGFLAELDRVGDFSVNGVGLNSNETAETENVRFLEEENDRFLEVREGDSEFRLSRASSTENVGFGEEEEGKDSKTSQEQITNSEMLVIEARSLEDIDLVFKGTTESVSKETEVDIDSGMPIIEAQSVEDIDLGLKDAEEVEVEDEESTTPDVEINSRMPIIEARSLEDIDLAFKDAEPIMSREAEVENEESTTPDVEIKSRMPVTVEQSVEDIGLALKDGEPIMSREAEVENEESTTPDVEIKSRMPVTEEQSVEDIDLALKDAEPIMSREAEVEDEESTSPDVGIDSRMPMIEARSVEDIDLAFKNTESMSKEDEVKMEDSIVPENDVDYEMPIIEDIDLALKDAEPIMSREAEVEDEESTTPNVEINSRMPMIEEARSLEDIDLLAFNDTELMSKEVVVKSKTETRSLEDLDLGFKNTESTSKEGEVTGKSQVPEDGVGFNKPELDVNFEMPIFEDRSIEDINTACEKNNEKEGDEKPFVLELPVLEARSIEDIDSAFKQIQGEVYSEKPIISVPVHEKLVVESKYPWGESNSDLEMVEARSLEDIDTAFKQATEDNKENDSRTDESGFQSSSNTRP